MWSTYISKEIEKMKEMGRYKYKFTRVKGEAYLEHRLIMEIYLCRSLLPNEVVHHLNGDCKDNRLDNLRLMGRKEHSRLHRMIDSFQQYHKWPKKLANKIVNEYLKGNTTYRKLERKYSVPRSTIWFMVNERKF